MRTVERGYLLDDTFTYALDNSDTFSELTSSPAWPKLKLYPGDWTCSSMRWFRANMRTGSSTALFALTIQLVLSFVHLHLLGIAPLDALGDSAVVCTSHVSTGGTDSQTIPRVPKSPHRSSGDFCAICSLIQFAGDLVPASSPPLPSASALSRPLVDPGEQAVRASSRRGFFQSRAPPRLI
jgi:hypothetical protein